MLRPSALIAFGVPSGTSFRSAPLTKLDSELDIRLSPSLCKHINRRLAFREAKGGVSSGPTVFVDAYIRSVSGEAYEELVPGGMSGAGRIRPATTLPFFKHGTKGGQDLSVGVVPEHGPPHLMKEPISGVSGVEVLQNLPSYILHFQRNDGIENHPHACILAGDIHRFTAERSGERLDRDIQPTPREHQPSRVEEASRCPPLPAMPPLRTPRSGQVRLPPQR